MNVLLFVRSLLVPAFMRLTGRATWWAPAPLRRFHERFGLSEGESAPRATATTVTAKDDESDRDKESGAEQESDRDDERGADRQSDHDKVEISG